MIEKSRINRYTRGIIYDIKTCEDGDVVTTRQLIDYNYKGFVKLVEDDYVNIHNDLIKAVKKNKIKLVFFEDDIYKDMKPCDIPYIIHNKQAQTKCPFCGKRNVASLINGYVFVDERMQKKFDSGKLAIGAGCVCSTIAVDGAQCFYESSDRCNECGREFGYPAILVSEDRKTGEFYKNIVTSIEFSLWHECSEKNYRLY